MRQLTSMKCLDRANISPQCVRSTPPLSKLDNGVSIRRAQDRRCWCEEVLNLACVVLMSSIPLTVSALAIWRTYLALIQYSSFDLINALAGA